MKFAAAFSAVSILLAGLVSAAPLSRRDVVSDFPALVYYLSEVDKRCSTEPCVGSRLRRRPWCCA